ncbi:hypothetical protein BDW71DRAFT_182856 [Aspergillus fruticulosus]
MQILFLARLALLRLELGMYVWWFKGEPLVCRLALWPYTRVKVLARDKQIKVGFQVQRATDVHTSLFLFFRILGSSVFQLSAVSTKSWG